jgi:hypothetical protein
MYNGSSINNNNNNHTNLTVTKNEKYNYIISAIESGWSVKKVSKNDYQFSKRCKFTDDNNQLCDVKRSFSLPITKKDYYNVVSGNIEI